MRILDFFKGERAALISDHVWLVDQRDTLKAASKAEGIATMLEM